MVSRKEFTTLGMVSGRSEICVDFYENKQETMQEAYCLMLCNIRSYKIDLPPATGGGLKNSAEREKKKEIESKIHTVLYILYRCIYTVALKSENMNNVLFSCISNPLDFFSWGIIKVQVY